jgi:TatD DNase family protein
LAPVPYRGKRNESLYIVEVLEKLSSIYGLSLKNIAEITTKNSKDIFNI